MARVILPGTYKNQFFREPLTGAVIGTGKGGNWREKPPDAESDVGARIPKVWANARTCPVHAVLARF